MRIIVAPDKFKGSLSGPASAAAMARGVRSVFPDAQIISCPLADGGEGTVTALVAATGGRLVRKAVCGPRPEMQIDAEFGMLGDGQTAVIEMAAASGLTLLPIERRNPLHTTTCGTGQLILAARAMGARRIILGIGGSATNDGGIGALQALGVRFILDTGPADAILTGVDLAHVRRVECPPDLHLPELLIACDVTNPLCGPNGTSSVYGLQKGATAEDVAMLDEWLHRFADLTGTLELAGCPGSGAAGGLGYGLCAMIPHARMASGFDLVAEALHFDQLLAGADWCLTAEGRLDASSFQGKTAVGVARLCHRKHVPCTILAGSVELQAEALAADLGAAAFAISDGPMTLAEAMARTEELLERAAARVMRIAGRTVVRSRAAQGG